MVQHTMVSCHETLYNYGHLQEHQRRPTTTPKALALILVELYVYIVVTTNFTIYV